ncbi:putative nucleotidyltransferase substrate binding domain-containing protein [Vibrio sp. E150_011]
MPDKFNMSLPPFDRLSEREQSQLRASLDVAYFREKDVLLKSNQTSPHLFILIKGAVEERDNNSHEIYAHYTYDDMFDVRAQFGDPVKHHYVALEDTLTYLLPTDVFLSLYQANGQFAAYFDSNLATRQQLVEDAQKQQNLAEFILTQVDEDIYHPALIIHSDRTITDVTQQLLAQGVDAALVELKKDDPRRHEHHSALPYGIVTRTNMLHAVVLEHLPCDTPISDIATFPVHHVEKEDFLFNAMVTMTRQRVKRLMVCDGALPVGMLDMTQILSTFSTHSHVLSLSIARSNSIEELALASTKQQQLVDSLMSNGIRTRFMMELISAVNEQIIEKAFELVLPPAIQNHCCFIVLGSEGRGEQILKTDQDNALILDDGLDWPAQQTVLETLSHTLARLGYPLCPGKVMVSNNKWVKSISEWHTYLNQLISKATPDSIMELAILADARAVAGNLDLLTPISVSLRKQMKGQELILADFARPALTFGVPLTLFGNVKTSKEGLDIKQGGIFPIVHGVRALSLEYGLEATNTFDRIDQLVKHRVLETSTADNLSEALKQFFKLRLQQQLRNHHTHNAIQLDGLERPERDLLRHGLHVVKKFKQWLGYHYQIRL